MTLPPPFFSSLSRRVLASSRPSSTEATGTGARQKAGLLRRCCLIAFPCLILSAAAAAGWAGWLRLTGNIHEIEPGIYRSGQLGAARLATFVRDHEVKTVINLRGRHPGSPWYDAEVVATARAGVRYVSLPMSADHQPDQALLDTLVDTLRTAQPPLLIHCNGGADRSALASAPYELVVMHRSASDAERQLSFGFGHFPWLLSHTGAMDRTFAEYAGHGGPD